MWPHLARDYVAGCGCEAREKPLPAPFFLGAMQTSNCNAVMEAV